MNISPYEFEKAKEGSLFVKKGNKLVPVSIDELVDPLKKEVSKIGELEFKYSVVSKTLESYKTLKIAHFISVFMLFELKVLKSEIEISDDELLNLDEKVLKGELTVEEALKKHPYFKETYEKLFGKVAK